MAGERITSAFLRGVANQKWAVKPNLMVDIVDQHGSVDALKFFASRLPRYEKILKIWGPLRTHYLATVISVVNGCRYCAYGHGFAFQLHYFDQIGSLFSIDEERMLAAAANGRERAFATFETALIQSGLDDEVQWLHRLVKVLDSGPQDSEDDQRLQHLVEMFAFLTACGIEGETELDSAHDPINKNHELKAKYELARAHFV